MYTDVRSERGTVNNCAASAPAPGRHTLSQHTDALVIDGSLRQALVTTQSLGRSGLRVGTAESRELCDSRSRVPAFASRWSAWNAHLPNFSGDPDVFGRSVLALAREHQTRVVIPSSDGAIAALRPLRDCFERENVALPLASEPALDVANDKLRTLEAAARLGINGPRTVAISAVGEARAALAEVGYPAVIKPTQSWVQSRHRSARFTPSAVHDEVEAVTYLEEIYECGSTAVIQQWVSGPRESVNLMYASGRVVASIAQVTHRTTPMLGGVNVVRETIRMPDDLSLAARALVDEIGLEGYSEVEFRRDSAGRPLIMEINARLTAGVALAVRSGVDFPTLLWRWAAGESLPSTTGYRTGVRMRFLAGDLEWLWENLKHPGRADSVPPVRAVGVFLREFLHPQAYDYIEPSDIRPAWVALARDIGDARRRFIVKTSRSSPSTPSPTEKQARSMINV